MTKRIFRSIFLVAAVVLAACLALTLGVLDEYFTAELRDTLRVQTAFAAQGVEHDGAAYFAGLDAGGYRLTWVAADGAVLYDNEADPAAMENHAGREEIREALDTGAGEGERRSATRAEKTLYRAERLADGTVLRVSVTRATVLSLLRRMQLALLGMLAAALALSALLANRLSRRVVGPLNTLDLDRPLENDAYEELAPLLTRIERQHRQIGAQLEELRRRQDEFAAVTASMSEGLILLNSRGTILSINPAARRLFGAGEDCVGRDMLTVDRSRAMQELVSAAQGGARGERVMALAGGEYQVDASPVLSDGRCAGVCVLAFDVTARLRAEQLRREFTANVSHELKTPLQTILGSAELIENGLVQPADLARFAGRIRTEAERLVALIGDILRLSQLDEGAQLPREETDLLAVAREAAASLREEAAARGITLAVTGERVCVSGVRQLLYEIARNLCDNAVKYNRDGGSVELAVSRTPEGAALTVTDTGVGIPASERARVFERFYRVDKSRSRAVGGTGLGLSIVKHAAQYHGAAIDLGSEEGKGTRVRVTFPKQ